MRTCLHPSASALTPDFPGQRSPAQQAHPPGALKNASWPIVNPSISRDLRPHALYTLKLLQSGGTVCTQKPDHKRV